MATFILFYFFKVMADGRSECFRILFLLIVYYLVGDININVNIARNWRLKDFSIFHQNIRGLLRKKDLLEIFLADNNVKVAGISETLLNEHIPTSFLNIEGYSFVRRDRGVSGGGIGLYVKNGIEYIRRFDFESDDIEFICLEILSTHTKPLFICCLYRPPDTSKHLSKNFVNNFKNILSKVLAENKETIIVSDINCNYLDNESAKPIKEMISLFGFKQCIKGATRITENTESLIDVILSTNVNALTSIGTIPTYFSDHHGIGCVRKLNNNKLPSETIECRNYSNYNPESLRNDLCNENWNKVYSEQNPNKAWYSMKKILQTNIEKHAPTITKRIKAKMSPWLTSNIKTEMNRRDMLHRKFLMSRLDEDFNAFKTQRNRVNVLVRKAKKQHSTNLLTESANDPNRFWKSLKKIFPIKDKISCTKTFLIDNVLTTNAKTIADKFCLFFSNVAYKLKTKALPLKNFTWATPAPMHHQTYNRFRFKNVTVAEVFKHLKKLSRKKASGPDNIPPGILKDMALIVAKPLCHIINLSMQHGIVPSDFKIGKITPVFKSGSRVDMDNYRPITVLPTCSKVFEKCIHHQLMTFLEENKLLSATQFGYRKKRNTELAATLLLDEIRRNMDKGQVTGSIFIDLSKAFDTLSHAQIIESLTKYGVTEVEKELFIDYLFNRKQMVCFNREVSTYQHVNCGVPQGSILGPLLFLIVFNNIESTLSHCKIITYADDTVIYTSAKTTEVVEKLLQSDFKSLADWLKMNDLVINLKKGKTECILFGTCQRIINKTLNITHHHHTVSFATTYKYLGVHLDQTLSLCSHLEKTYKKASGRLYLLKRVRPYLTIEAALTIYTSMLVPLFTYCSILNGNPSRTYEKKIENMEDRAYKTIYKQKRDQRSKFRTVKELVKKRLCLQVYKCLKGNTCDNFKNYFEIMMNKTRNNNCIIRLEKVKLECCRKSFFFNGAREFNSLPINIRSAGSENQFLKLYKEVSKV